MKWACILSILPGWRTTVRGFGLAGVARSVPIVPEKGDSVIAGDGFLTLPTASVIDVIDKFETDVNTLVKVTVLLLVLQPYVVIDIVPTIIEAHVAVATL